MQSLPPSFEILQSLGIALGLGLLVGLQREWVGSQIAGIRTFALGAIFGALNGLLGLAFGGWVIAAGLVAFASMLILGNLVAMKSEEPDAGLTTEMALLVMFAIGVLTVLGHRLEAAVTAGGVMVLLQSKDPLHGMIRRIGAADLKEISRLVLAGLVILPLLPNREMGYLGVFNPFSIWLMVVLIVGISLAAYLAQKFLGESRGSVLAGLLGGLVSSTATTASLSRRSKDNGACGKCLAAIALTASAVVFLRVMVEVILIAPAHLWEMLPPLVVMTLGFGLVAAWTQWSFIRSGKSGAATEAPPSELKSAVLFALLYAVVLLLVATAKEHFGQSGLYVAAAISGLTDMDAITLSTSRLVSSGNLDADTAWRMILVGGMANIVFKGVLVSVLGTGAFVKMMLGGFGAALLAGLGLLLLWP